MTVGLEELISEIDNLKLQLCQSDLLQVISTTVILIYF